MPRAFRTHTRGALPRPDGHGRRITRRRDGRKSVFQHPRTRTQASNPTMLKPPPRVLAPATGSTPHSQRTGSRCLEQADTRGRTTNQWAAEVGIQIDSSAIPSDKPEGGAVAADLPAAAAVGAGETAVSTAATSCAMLPASAPSVGIRRCPVPSSLVVVWLACMWGSLSMPGENWASVAD
jgi:hypothetical protein